MSRIVPPLLIWIRVPLRAVERAIAVLKEQSMLGHRRAQRDKKNGDVREAADKDESYAEAFKQSLRDDDEKPRGPQ
jgi:hypothetical protein